MIDYIRAMDEENSNQIFYMKADQQSLPLISRGRYWVFIYEMNYTGLLTTRNYEYIIVSENETISQCLSEEQKLALFQNSVNEKQPMDICLDRFDDIRMCAEDTAETQKEATIAEASGKNMVKITSRIHAVQALSEMRIQEQQDKLIGISGKEEERVRKAIDRERQKTAGKIAILEEKLNCTGGPVKFFL